MNERSRMTTSSPELLGIKYSADGSAVVRVRVSLVVVNDPIARSTNSGTRVCELQCENDDEERVLITVWREHADHLADAIKKGNLVQFMGLTAKKVYNPRFAYGALPYALHYSGGSNFTVVDSNYRLAGMPVVSLEDLEADIEFLQSSPTDPRVRIRRVKARVSANGLVPFSQGVVGTVLAYSQHEPAKSLPLKVQVEFVPADKRKSLIGGMWLDMRGMVALPQLEGDPVEFRVARYDDIDLRDNVLGPWLDSAKTRGTTERADDVLVKTKKTAAVVASSSRVVDASAMGKNWSLSGGSVSVKSSSMTEVPGTELTKLKGIAMDDFAAGPEDGAYVGSVYVKDLQSHVTVTVRGATAGGVSGFKEGRMLEMRGVLYDVDGTKRLEVLWPQIAKSGKLPALKQVVPPPPTITRVHAAELKTVSVGPKLLTGKVVAEGEQRGAHACFDVFVKDSTGKCAITVAVCGDLRDVQTSEIIEKEVDFKGTVKDNGFGELEFFVSGWQDLIPRSVLNEAKVPESPSIVALNKNFDFMSTNSPPTKTSESESSVVLGSAAVHATTDDDDVTNVTPNISGSAGGATIKEEKLADVTNDPSFSMLQSGGGQLQTRNLRSSADAFQRPVVPATKPRSARKGKPSGDVLSETPTKKPKPSTSVSSRPRRANTWLQQLGELKSVGGSENPENERNGEDSSSSVSTFNDALSNLSAASNTVGTRPLDFSSFIDDEAKEVNNGEDEGEEAGDGRCG